MPIYKDFIGLNIGVYDPILDDDGSSNDNIIGYSFDSPLKYSDAPGSGNSNISFFTSHLDYQTIHILNLHRNGPYGYPTWKQIRTSENPLSRASRKSNTFSYTEEHTGRFGETRRVIEPVVASSYKPISLVGEVEVYSENLNQFEKRTVELKTSFANETVFFANSEVNDYFETIAETDHNYELLKEMYLDGGLEDEGSPIQSFNLITYRQTIWPKQKFSFLNRTRSRKFYLNTFWRSNRDDRRENNVPDNGFGAIVAEQSIWPLDDRRDFESRQEPLSFTPSVNRTAFQFDIGGLSQDNAESGPGILQNRYSKFLNGDYSDFNGVPGSGFSFGATIDLRQFLTASITYSRLHTLKNAFSVVNPSGVRLDQQEFTDSLAASTIWPAMTTGSIFNGTANWDAGVQSGKEPFYDSYDDFAENLRIKGKSFSIVPEFKISSHVKDYLTKGIVDELPSIFELSGAASQNSTTDNTQQFYQILSNSDFLKHFDLIKKDHKDLATEKVLTLKCKALKKFLPYDGFYPAQRTEQISKQFYDSYSSFVESSIANSFYDIENDEQFSFSPLLSAIASPGILFNTIKSGVAVDYPLIFSDDLITDITSNYKTFTFFNDLGRRVDNAGSYITDGLNNAMISHTKQTYAAGDLKYRSIYSSRIPFEALVEPETYLANQGLISQEPHPFALSESEFECRWDGQGDPLFKKMSSNFLAEVPDFFMHNENFKTISSLEEENPEFGNAISGNYYVMRIKMTKSRNRPNYALGGYSGFQVTPPQDVASIGIATDGTNTGWELDYTNRVVRETLTMYSRPTAFGPPVSGDGSTLDKNGLNFWNGSTWGYNFPYTPPYYHGDAWCDLVFKAPETRKFTLDEILTEVQRFPYYTRYWDPSTHDAMRDLSGYDGDTGLQAQKKNKYYGYGDSPWGELIGENGFTIDITAKSITNLHEQLDWGDFHTGTELKWLKHVGSIEQFVKSQGPQSPLFVNYNAMQLDSSINLFGKGTIRTKNLEGRPSDAKIEVASGDTVRGKSRWIIQSKFETPILNFNKYDDLSNSDLNCTEPSFAKSQVPRGMWHQYGDLPTKDEGIYLEVEDIPKFWLRGALGIDRNNPKIKSLADLVGFKKDKVRLGEVADVKQISEAVVAVPFIEKDGTRQFFSIPREDIDSCIGAVKREVEEGTFVAGGPPKAGDSVYQMVKKMQKYVFPPSMDFVRYKEIDPFAMYVFEFKHNLTKKDLSDIWQNLPPDIGTRMEEAEATISHELLAHELLGGGAVVKNGVLDDNAEGNGIPSNIQWMIFKAKKRAKTNYFDKVVAKKGTTEDTSSQQLENAQGQTGDDLGITYNWPYDFFSLVELVKIDAEVTFANIENDDKGQKTIKKVEKKSPVEMQKIRDAIKNIDLARGKGKPKK